jgi:hypothetical protein
MLEPQFFTLFNLIVKRDAEGIDQLIASDDLDFEAFKKFIQRHQLAGAFYTFLSDSPSRSNFPDSMIQEFKHAYLMQWSKNENFIKELGNLRDVFGKAGSEVMFLKGLFLAQRFYGNIDERSIGDIDILVKMADLDRVDGLLKENGFERKSKVLLNEHLTTFFTHHFEYARDDLVVELHWALSTHFTFKINYGRVWNEKSAFEFKNKSYWLLSDEYELVLQIISIFKDIELNTIALKSFIDIYKILQSITYYIDWKTFFINRENEGLHTIAINICDIVLGLMDCYDEFPELSLYLKQNVEHLRTRKLDEKLSLLDQRRPAILNKLWALRLYRAHPAKTMGWWILSLPFRLAVYKKT